MIDSPLSCLSLQRNHLKMTTRNRPKNLSETIGLGSFGLSQALSNRYILATGDGNTGCDEGGGGEHHGSGFI